MLIKALCDYYDILSQSGAVLPEGYSKVKIHYCVALTADGRIDGILDRQIKTQIPSGKKTREKQEPVEMQMPQRTEKPGIEANIAEHRPLYLFGLNLDKDHLSPDDRTEKARKSHQAFVEANLKFTEGIHSPVVSAYRNFLTTWNPEKETENSYLLGLGKNYAKSGFSFCLSGNPDRLLHEDPEFKKRWEDACAGKGAVNDSGQCAQCAITGDRSSIARIHNKIRGIYGGHATGNVLVGFNNDSENSYGNEQSYNSNISETAMKKYTEALNYLLGNETHKAMIDETTVVFWAMSSKTDNEDLFARMLLGRQERLDEKGTEEMLKSMFSDAGDAKLTLKRLQSSDRIDPDVDFYILGLKPNSSRLSVKFMVRRKYADVLWNIARFQRDLQMNDDIRPVALWQIRKEMISPKSRDGKVDPAVMARIFEAVINGRRYPDMLLETIVRRVKTDSGNEKINAVRAGIIKACVNRNHSKEELKVSLDKTNLSQAYLCGRLFAVLEKLQQSASNQSLNRTIRDSYFASASTKPAVIFPKLLRLAQNHLGKLKTGYQVYYSKLIGEIMDGLEREFPDTLRLVDQGRFDIGYYHQMQELWKKTDKGEAAEKEEN